MAEIPISQVDAGVRAIPLQQRATLVAVANCGNPAVLALRDQPLVEYVNQVDNIGTIIGAQDPVRTMHYIQSVSGANDAASVATVNGWATHLQSNIGLSPEQIANPAIMQACMRLHPSAHNDPVYYPATKRAVQLYGAGVTEHHVATLHDMFVDNTHYPDPNLVGLQQVAQYQASSP
jgi:hypothetical protein